MRIGILTHHYVKNYGAYLQMKALYEKLTCLYPNAEVVIVNYVNKKHWRKNIIHVLHYRKGIDTIKSYGQKIKQLFVFTKYERSLPRTKKVRTSDQIVGLGLDLIVFGSDEIWNIKGSGFHPLKFGCGFDQKTPDIIAYAPSVGAVTKETNIPDGIDLGLKNFKRLSGRDHETVKFIKRSCGVDATKMLDPTFLYDFNKDIGEQGIQPMPFKYILIYDCKLTDQQSVELRKYADERNLKIIGAGDYKSFYDEVTIKLTPFEWVNLFRNAEKVITGTFHGTVFSIKYDKNFVSYPTEENRINKVGSLLEDMGLKDRLLKVGNESGLCDLLEITPDYQGAYEYIERKKIEADQFLLTE